MINQSKKPVECPCCGTKRNESHRSWCPAPPRMKNLPMPQAGCMADERLTENGGKASHPCQKPLDVVMPFLMRLGDKTYLDPFMGTGTTLLAAKLLGRRAVGIEIEERYCEMAARRLAQDCLALGG